MNWAVPLVVCTRLSLSVFFLVSRSWPRCTFSRRKRPRTWSKQLLVFTASAAHIWFIFKKEKIFCFCSLCFTSIVPPSPSVPLTFPHPSFLPASRIYFPVSFLHVFKPIVLPHLYFVLIYIFPNPLCLNSHSSFLSSLPSFVSHSPLLSLFLLFQIHCSPTLASPHINPSLPSSVPHN